MHRASAPQFLPHNSAAYQSMVVVSMQMDAYLKKEQIGTLFVWVGPRQGGPAQNLYPPSTRLFITPPVQAIITHWCSY